MRPNYLVILVYLGEGGRLFVVRPGATPGRRLELLVRAAIAYHRDEHDNEPQVPPGIYVFAVDWSASATPMVELRKRPKAADDPLASLDFERRVAAGLREWDDTTEDLLLRPVIPTRASIDAQPAL